MLRIQGWARDGLTDDQIAAKMGVHPATLYRWQADHRELRNAIKKGKAPVDIEVENALLKSALGYTVKVKKPIKVKEVKVKVGEGRIETERIEYAEEEVHIPPNTMAQIYWLNNRKPDRWRNRKAADVDATDNAPVTIVWGRTQ